MYESQFMDETRNTQRMGLHDTPHEEQLPLVPSLANTAVAVIVVRFPVNGPEHVAVISFSFSAILCPNGWLSGLNNSIRQYSTVQGCTEDEQMVNKFILLGGMLEDGLTSSMEV